MRSDENLNEDLRSSDAWDNDQVTGKSTQELRRLQVPSLQKARMSFSGHERNHLFINEQGQSFADVSGVSGINTDADSRSFALVDFNRDGWLDIVLANVTSPVVSFYRNQLGQATENADHQILLVDCIGGNQNPSASSEFTNRDAYGAKISVTLEDDRILLREKRGGEGLAAQNSSLIHFGLGKNQQAMRIEIRWPSGRIQRTENVPAGSLVRCFEDANQSTAENGIEIAPLPSAYPTPNKKADYQQRFQPNVDSDAAFRMYVSMATWCPNCKRELPQVGWLREQFDKSDIEFIGVPIDPADKQAKLSEYMIEQNPAYEISSNWKNSQREAFRQLVKQNLGFEGLPATLVTDNAGNVLGIFNGIANVSQLSKLGVPISESTHQLKLD